MSKITYIRNFFFNVIQFFKIAAKSKTIYWNYLVSNIVNCNIDRQARIFNNHILHNVTVGKGTYVAYNAYISNTNIGKFCSIGPNILCGFGFHPTNGISSSPVFYSTKMQAGFTLSEYDKCEERKIITIGNDVFIGMNVTILDGVSIGDGAVIGAGAVVTKDIPAYAVAVGCPIKIIKYRFSKEIIDSLIESRWWDKDDTVLREVEKNFFEVENFLENIKTRNDNLKKPEISNVPADGF
jgi:acetyltransferase-like isoleucine patch superfamily enzyme